MCTKSHVSIIFRLVRIDKRRDMRANEGITPANNHYVDSIIDQITLLFLTPVACLRGETYHYTTVATDALTSLLYPWFSDDVVPPHSPVHTILSPLLWELLCGNLYAVEIP